MATVAVAKSREEGQPQVFLVDPPWAYNARNNPGTRFCLGVHGHYPVMTVEEICALSVKSIAAPDAVLFLWGTWPKLPWALRVMESWGFTYKTVGFVWVKVNKDGSPWFGVGYYQKSNTEFCLLGTRGKVLKPATNGVSQIILAQRGPHSQKPEEARRRIELLYPTQRKVELFARQEAEGWTCLGNEIDGQDLREVLSVR